VYELVLRRFLATLAPDAQWKTMKILFKAGGEEYTATGGQLLEPGWHAVYPFSEAKEVILPHFQTWEELPIRQLDLEEKETQPPARYTQSKLIQMMEKLGLGTKSTRHEVIAKLVSRKYVEGNPLRPTLVGRGVTESLEHHADTIIRPDMTQTIEAHMQQIKEKVRTREDVIQESREMLHLAFDQLEPNEGVIGDDIRGRTSEELNLGRCPVCNGTLAIKHMRGNIQFIGCSCYPACSFNIGLPAAQWGFAVRADEVCDRHHLHFVRLVRKGARPWDIGCPLCQQINSNIGSLQEIPSMTASLISSLHARHIYTVAELARSEPDALALQLGIPEKEGRTLTCEAASVLERLRRRSECRKFMREHLIPRKGRSYSKILTALKDAGILEMADLARADLAKLRAAGVGEGEAEELLADARVTYHGQVLKEIGIPRVSLKKYLASGIITPEMFCELEPAALSKRTGMSIATVEKHRGIVCAALNRAVPKKMSKPRIERAKKYLLSLKGLTEMRATKLIEAGIIDDSTLLAADLQELAGKTGIPTDKIREYQVLARKKRDNAILRI
jgi:DNA topoisomerase-1